jgi:hypothetical protein
VSRGAAAPYLSVVVVGRNDGYGGDFLGRFRTFVRSFSALAEALRLPSEIVIVEWNPPSDRPRLADAVGWNTAGRKWCSAKVITVPPEVHTEIAGGGGQPLLEYFGKNIGIRRAAGEFVLATNPDVLLSPKLVRFLARRLSPANIYRVDRWDVRPPIPEGGVLRQLWYCARNVLKIHATGRSYDPDFRRQLKIWRDGFREAPQSAEPHLNGAGDFIAMSRGAWASVRGFPELERFGASHHIDALAVYEALASGLTQSIIPARLYHQDHARPDPGKPGSPAVHAALDGYREQLTPQRLNGEDWGLAGRDLPVRPL